MPSRARHVDAERRLRAVTAYRSSVRPVMNGGLTGGAEQPMRTPTRRSDAMRADLRGFAQVPPVLTAATGTFRARLGEGTIQYELTYQDLSSDAFAAHIHFGHPTDNGGIVVFLCGGDDKPACPVRGGTVRGTITADNILAIPEQGLMAHDARGFLRILRAGLTYVNVHTQNFPDGEIRGQVRFGS